MPERLVEAVIRDADDDDAAAVLSLNNACVPALGPVDLEKMRWFLDNCPYFRLVAVEERKAPRTTEGNGATPAQGERAPDDGRTNAAGPIVEGVPEHSNLAGFLIGMTPEVPYTSGNFKWFLERSDDFVYIDRIAVSPWFRKRGIAARLYGDIERYARGHGAKRITLEVNVRPHNDASLAFHERMGFAPLDERETDYGTRVVMMEKML